MSFIMRPQRFVSPDATITHTASPNSTSQASSYTFSAQAISTAGSTRDVVGAFTVFNDGTRTGVATSCTLGGVSATLDVSITSDANTAVYIYRAAVPTGTTADIVINFDANVILCSCGVYAMYDAGDVHDTDSAAASATNPITNTLTIPAGGGCISAAGHNDDPGRTSAWTNLTEDYDSVLSTYYSASSASDAFAALQTERVISMTASSTPDTGSVATVAYAKA